jgi:hypothetical protein
MVRLGTLLLTRMQEELSEVSFKEYSPSIVQRYTSVLRSAM